MIIQYLNYYVNRRRFRQEWKAKNRHNETIILGDYPDGVITVGHNTYGGIYLDYYGMPNEKLVIGSFCSIAHGVVFATGGGIILIDLHHIQ
jgi:acetyltransferase-like isoleucine patch superfamily enzyme